MFAYQRLVSGFIWFFSLEFLWLMPFWEKIAPLPKWDEAEAFNFEEWEKNNDTSGLSRMWVGVIITFLFGALVGYYFPFQGFATFTLLVPLVSFFLFLFERWFLDFDDYTCTVSIMCLVVGTIWGLGALLGIFIA